MRCHFQPEIRSNQVFFLFRPFNCPLALERHSLTVQRYKLAAPFQIKQFLRKLLQLLDNLRNRIEFKASSLKLQVLRSHGRAALTDDRDLIGSAVV